MKKRHLLTSILCGISLLFSNNIVLAKMSEQETQELQWIEYYRHKKNT